MPLRLSSITRLSLEIWRNSNFSQSHSVSQIKWHKDSYSRNKLCKFCKWTLYKMRKVWVKIREIVIHRPGKSEEFYSCLQISVNDSGFANQGAIDEKSWKKSFHSCFSSENKCLELAKKYYELSVGERRKFIIILFAAAIIFYNLFSQIRLNWSSCYFYFFVRQCCLLFFFFIFVFTTKLSDEIQFLRWRGVRKKKSKR